MGSRLVRVLAVLAAAGYAATAAAPADAPGRKLFAILAAGRAQHSVHYIVAGSFGSLRLRQNGDAARARGIQRISFTKAGKTGRVTVIVAARTAYIRADAFALVE